MDYKQKYFKYKQKYLNLLKSQKGGQPFLMDILAGPVFSYLFERNQRLLQLIYTKTQPVMMQPLENFTLNPMYRLNLLSRSSISVLLATRLAQGEIRNNRLELQLANRIISRTHKLPEISPPTLATTLNSSNVIHSVTFHPNKHLLAIGSRDNTKLCSLKQTPDSLTATCLATMNSKNDGHSNWVQSVAFHPTLPFLATGSDDNTAKLWRIDKPDGLAATCVATMNSKNGGHSGVVRSVAFHPTLSLLATGSEDNTVKLWRFKPEGSAPTCVATLDSSNGGHRNNVKSVVFHPTLPLLATGSFDKTAKLWRLVHTPDGLAATCVATLDSSNRGHSSSVYSVAFHPILPLLATGSEDNTAKLWSFSDDGSAATCVATLDSSNRGHSSGVYSVAFHPTLLLLATGSADNTTKLWRFLANGSAATCVATLDSSNGMPDSYIFSVAFHPTAPFLATGSYDRTVKFWRL